MYHNIDCLGQYVEGNPGLFLLEAEKESEPLLKTTDSNLGRKDFDTHIEGHIRAITIGHPYTDIPLNWLSAARLIELYRNYGMSLLSSVHGFFTLVIKDSRIRRAFIITSRVGGYGVFCAKTENAVLFSDSIELLAGKLGSMTIDSHALLEFLELGFFLGEKTHFKEIRRISPSLIIEISDKAITETAYWHLSDGEDAPPYRCMDFVESFTSHVRNAFSISDMASLSMTGGFDSRAILASCRSTEEQMHCFTIGNKMNDDVRTASKVSKLAGYAHTLYPVSKESIHYGLENLGELLHMCNGSRNCFHFISFAEQAYRNEADFCDVFMAGAGATELYRTSFQLNPENLGFTYASAIHNKLSLSRNLSRTIFKPETLEISEHAVVINSVLSELSRSGEDNLLRASEWLFLNSRIANFIAVGPAICGRYMRVWDPWLFTPLMKYVMNIPTREKMEDIIPRSIISANNKSLAQIPANRMRVEIGRQSISGFGRLFFSQGEAYLIRLLNKVHRKLTGWNIVMSNYVQDYHRILAREFCNFYPNLFEELEDSPIKDLLDKNKVLNAADSMIRGDIYSCHLLTNLICSNTWFKIIEKYARLKV